MTLKMFIFSITLRDRSQTYDEVPLLRTQFVLRIPAITISPNIDKLQSAFNEVIKNLLAIHIGVKQWGQHAANSTERRDTLGTEYVNGHLNSVRKLHEPNHIILG